MSGRPAEVEPSRVDDESFGVVPGLVWAFRIHEDGSADPLPLDHGIDRRHDGWLWLHLNLADLRAVAWVRAADLPAAAAELLLSRDTHQQLHAADGFIYGLFADLVQGIEGCGEDIGHLRFLMTERLLISGRRQALSSVASARTTLERGGRRLPHVAALLELIVEHMGDAMDRLVDGLASELDHIEDSLALRTHSVERARLSRVRRTAVKLHRQLSGLRILFHRLERQGIEDLKPQLRVAAGRLAQRLDALDHEIMETRDRARLLQEEITALAAEETNRHLYVLSVLTTLVLPPTLVTGVFGMNIKGLPFTETEDGFLWAAALMAASALAVYMLLRRIGAFKL
ncbi:MAG TPA: CorA family divalent cation transporter [Xanthobacteraceae bacterium]|jgi:zinc transporter